MTVNEIVDEWHRLSIAAKALGDPIAYIVYPDASGAFQLLVKAIEEARQAEVDILNKIMPHLIPSFDMGMLTIAERFQSALDASGLTTPVYSHSPRRASRRAHSRKMKR